MMKMAFFGAVEVAHEPGADGDQAVDTAVELGLDTGVGSAVNFGLGDHGDRQSFLVAAFSLGLHVGLEVVGLGVADAADAPVDVDDFVDHLGFGVGGGLPVGEFAGGDGVADLAGLGGQEGAFECEGLAVLRGLLGGALAAGPAFRGFGASGFGAVFAGDAGAFFWARRHIVSFRLSGEMAKALRVREGLRG